MKYNTKSKKFLYETGNIVPDELLGSKFNYSKFQRNFVEKETILCVVMSISFEFAEQMPCKHRQSPSCEWSYFSYVPANCNNFHGSICQHKDYSDSKWTLLHCINS